MTIEGLCGAVKRRETKVLIGLIILLVCVVCARIPAEARAKEVHETNVAMRAMQEIQMQNEAKRAQEIALVESYHRSEAEAVARVLYGTALHNSEDGQRAVVWCIINRVESSLFPDSVVEVCQQDSQWMGYSDGNPILKNLYDLADEELSNWRNNGYRTISPDYLFLTWSRDEITLRTTFEETPRTHYWRA